MNDLKPFKHGEEGTHYVCQEVLELKGGKATCCGCSGHKCKKPKPMKRIKKEVEKQIKSCENCSGVNEHTHNCPLNVLGRVFDKATKSKPQDKCEFCGAEHSSKEELKSFGCWQCGQHPKPTKIKKLREWDFDMTGLAPEATTAIRILGNKINQIIDLLSH